jgi:hypothetical protein
LECQQIKDYEKNKKRQENNIMYKRDLFQKSLLMIGLGFLLIIQCEYLKGAPLKNKTKISSEVINQILEKEKAKLEAKLKAKKYPVEIIELSYTDEDTVSFLSKQTGALKDFSVKDFYVEFYKGEGSLNWISGQYLSVVSNYFSTNCMAFMKKNKSWPVSMKQLNDFVKIKNDFNILGNIELHTLSDGGYKIIFTKTDPAGKVIVVTRLAKETLVSVDITITITDPLLVSKVKTDLRKLRLDHSSNNRKLHTPR